MVKRGGPSARHGIHNTNGWNILKVGTLSIVLHVDTFPFQMLLKLLLHHMKGTQTGRRQCIKMEVLRGMRNLKVIRMPCMLGVNIRKTFWQIHLCVMLWTRHIKKSRGKSHIYQNCCWSSSPYSYAKPLPKGASWDRYITKQGELFRVNGTSF